MKTIRERETGMNYFIAGLFAGMVITVFAVALCYVSGRWRDE